MNRLAGFLAKRLAFTCVAVVALFTGMFALVMLTKDPNEILISFANPTNAEEAVQSYRETRGRNRPLWRQWVDWMVGYATLDWGYSFSQGRPVVDVVKDATLVTAVYVVPAVVVSTLASTAMGYYSAVRSRSTAESALRIVVYACAAVPAFLIAVVSLRLLISEQQWYTAFYDAEASPFARRNLETLVIPCLVLALALFGAQARYVRSQSLKYAGTEVTKLVRSKGAADRRVGRHVLRNAALPVISSTFTELLAVFTLSVFVIEIVFDIPGIGLMGYEAINDRDLGLVFGTMLVPILLGLLGNLLQDVAYAYLDPRIDLE